MKKLFAALLSLAMVASLAACGGGASSTPEQTVDEPASEAAGADADTDADDADTDGEEAPAGDAAVADGDISGDLRVVWWGGDSRHEMTLQVIDMFEEAYPGVTVVPEYMGGDTYWEKLDTQLAGGAAPDVIQMGGNIGDYVERGAIMPLNDLIDQGLIDTSLIDEAVISDATFNGDTYGICLGTNMLTLVYNKSMLEEAGAPLPENGMSWAELEAYCLEIADMLPDGVYPMCDDSSNETQSNYMGYYMRQQGTPVWDGEEVRVTVDNIESWLDLWTDYREKGIVPDLETSASYKEAGVDSSILVAGKAAICLLWSNQVVGYQEAMTDEIDTLSLPGITEGGIWSMPSQYFTVNAATENPAAAAAFINFFVNNADVGLLLGNDRGIPANSEVRGVLAASASETDEKVYNYVNYASEFASPMDPNLPNDQEYNSTLYLYMQQGFYANDNAGTAQEIYDLIHELAGK